MISDHWIPTEIDNDYNTMVKCDNEGDFDSLSHLNNQEINNIPENNLGNLAVMFWN